MSVRRIQRLCIATFSAYLAACASPVPARASLEGACDSTQLSIAFISDGDAATREKVEGSARQVAAILTSGDFGQRCRASDMNRTGGRSVEEVCRHFACAGSQTIKVGLYDDPDMRAVAFEKSGAVFFNIAKRRAGSPANVAHEFAHVLGYSHRTHWGVRRNKSVPYVVGRLIEQIAGDGPTRGSGRPPCDRAVGRSDDADCGTTPA